MSNQTEQQEASPAYFAPTILTRADGTAEAVMIQVESGFYVRAPRPADAVLPTMIDGGQTI